ncbi:Hrp-dependent type III effector protein [Mesorhizobium sp. BR1-1-16]|uniref:four-carbon acid sugar kinase family protein n=1 Tax=Mesorhizobium sp. BR1-1-16 TaxID=2876653 RepID=UPI001CCE735F|nr:four-carbon acid sugar kinase family protein [Mesorhizobium sp. BR1-1-16]MBZ9938455.1 Hrp-dependent type III effector protein [Mesorhizobium sp. BR1-1-16]
MTLFRLVADDLTGALDTSAQFAALIGPVPVVVDPKADRPTGSFAINMSCRDGQAAAAIAATRDTTAVLAGGDIAFKKIDSLLRGHWAAELAEVARSGLFRRIILAPAFPAQRRMTIGGRQILADATGAITLVAEPAAALARYGITVGNEAAALGDCGTEVLLLDAATDADLEAIVARHGGRAGTLWCGAAGLARALAGRPAPIIAPPSGSHLVLVGSHHHVTLRQIAAFSARSLEPIARYGADAAASARAITALMSARGRCVAIPDLPDALDGGEAARLIARWIGALADEMAPPDVLTVVGGETFAALCTALGAVRLLVEGESEPGIPASRMDVGRWRGVSCFSKSGAFGGEDWLVRQLAVA